MSKEFGESSDKLRLFRQFLLSARPLLSLLRVTGINLDYKKPVEEASSPERRHFWKQCWIAFLFLIHLESSVYMFARRGFYPMLQLLFVPDSLLSSGQLMETINSALIWLTSIIAETLMHFLLIWKIQPNIGHFFAAIQKLDLRYQSADLISIRHLSIVGLVSISIMVIIRNLNPSEKMAFQ